MEVNQSPCVAESSGEAIPVKEPDKSISIDSKSEFQVESINDVLEDIDDDKTDVKNANKEDNLQISSSIEELSECLGDQINKETAANTEKPNQTTTVVEDGNSVLQSGNEEILSVCAMDKMTNISLFDAENNGSLVEDLPPPPFTRQPPDGHEFPHNCTDPVDIKRDDFKPVIGKVANDCSSSGSPTGLEDSGVFLDDTTPTHWKIANTESSTAVLLSDIPQEEFRKAYATTVSNESVTSLSSVSENILLNTCCNMRDNRELLRDYDDSSSRSDIATSSCSDSMDELDTAPFTKTKMDQTVPIPPPRTSIQPRNNYQESKPVNGNCQNGVESSSVVSNETITTQQRSSITVAKSSLKPASYALEKTTITTLTKNIELGGLPQLEFQKSAQKWKSEENLRFPPLTRYKGREEQASLSVKERIAMFSKLDSESAVSRNSEYRRTEDARIKHAYSTDMLAERKDTTSTEVGSKSQNNSGVDTYYKNSTKSTSPTNADLTKQQCLRSNSSSPPQGSLQYSAFSGLSKSTSNVALASQCKSTRENEFRAQDVPTALTKPLSLLTDFPDVRRDYQMISAYPQTQLSQYKRYSASGLTYASNLVTDDPLKRSVNSGSLLSILETRKEKATKLKGLIIPDKPNASSSARQTLPTIASYTPVVLPKSETPVSSHALQLVKADLSQPCSRVSQSLPRGFDFKSVSNAQKDVVDSAVTRQQSQPLLSEPPWKCNKASLPKYSPAFKRRTFELPRSTVSSSVSPTPPSSLTSPLSPPPSSPSSICSSTASSSTGAKSPTPSKHNIFQFSLSHSKPVTPLLPEKAIISPPPFSSSDPEESIPSRKTSTATAPDTDKAPPPLPRLPPPADNSASSTTNNHIFPPLPSRPSLEKRSPSTNSYSSATRSEANLNSSSMWSSTASSTSVPDVEHAKLVATCSDPRYSKSISNGTSPLLQAKESSNKYDGYSSRDRLSSEKETPLMKESIRMEYANQNDNSVLRKSASESDFLYQATYIAPSNGGSGYCEEGYRRRDVSPKDSVYSTALYTGSQMQVQHLEQRMVNVENGRQNVYSSQRSEIGRTYYRNDAFPDDFLESDEDTNSLCSQKTEDSMNRQLMIQDNDSSSDSLERALSPEFRPRAISQQKTVLRNNSDSTDSVKNFRALAEKWQLRSATDNPRDVKSPPVPPLPPTSVPNRKDSQAQVSSGNNIRLPPSLFPRQQEQNPGPERKSSITMPTSTNPVSSTTGSAVKMREPRGGTSTGQTPPLQRPTSLIETHDKSRIDSIWENSSNTNNITSNTSNYSRRHSTSVREFSSEYRRSLSSADSNVKDPLDRLKLRQSGIMASNKQNSLSVSDIRKAFESQQSIQNGNHAKGPVRKLADDRSQLWSSKENVNSSTSPRMTIRSKSNEEHHLRMSSIDSTTSEPDTTSPPSRFSSVGSLNNSPPAEQYGSVTSLASTTSLISPQELQQLIDEANQSLEEAGTPTHEIHVVVLHREMAGGSIGITLAGGADYEIKEITVHKVITGSIADKDGRIRKGDRIISINGRNLKGVSHREVLEILKAPRPEVVLVLSRERSDPFSPSELPGSKVNSSSASNGFLAKTASSSDVSGIAASGGSNGAQTDCLCVQLIKDGAGLGFIIEGGKESPLGDRPLTIKRIFKGGIADRDGTLLPGDEIVSVNSQAVMNMTRTEAWNFMKKLPNGPVVIIIKRKS